MIGGGKLVKRDVVAVDQTALERWESEGGRALPPRAMPQRDGRVESSGPST